MELQDESDFFLSEALAIPELDAAALCDGFDAEALREGFYAGAGCLIIRNVFNARDMAAYNRWCERHMASTEGHANCRHPKQPDKRIINDCLERMSKDEPALLVRLLSEPRLNGALDALIGFARFGAVTTHWIEPGGDRQATHVDYPCHVKSGKFWRDDPAMLRRMFTPHQLNQVLPHFSVQTLIASDAMGKWNGSTEVVPGSHRIADVDVRVLDEGFAAAIEPRFINAELAQGDCLLFNRRLVHRGGHNVSAVRRNSLITQHVWLFGVGQHATDAALVERQLEGELAKMEAPARE